MQHHHRLRAIEAGGIQRTVDRCIVHFTHVLLLKLAGIVAQCRCKVTSGLTPPPVGASLLAIASGHPTSMSTDAPISRAGSLPQGFHCLSSASGTWAFWCPAAADGTSLPHGRGTAVCSRSRP
ncbi:hypothetical protein FHJ31_22670 [Pseudomonas sp. Fig-3]|nr:hypothetical protein FHJ31_22670 [Pseudomonas sp. Fig-3]